MPDSSQLAFDPEAFLANAGLGRRIVQLKADESFFLQGNEADSIFYLQKGRAKLTVVSGAGKEATITLLYRRLCGRRIARRSRRTSAGDSDSD